MLKWITGVSNGIIIYTNPQKPTQAEIGFIFKINPTRNVAMMSAQELEMSANQMAKFLWVNTYTFSIIRRKENVTDYDYLSNYEAILKKKNIKSENKELHRSMLTGTARMIQKYTQGATKHEYFLKVNTIIYNTSNDKEILKKHREVSHVVDQFPTIFRIEKLLNSKEVIIQLMKENRFVTSELNTIAKKDLEEMGFCKDILSGV